MPEKKPFHWKDGLIFLAVGSELVLFTVLGAFGGSMLDKRWETAPWAMVGGLFLGAAAGLVHFFRIARRFF